MRVVCYLDASCSFGELARVGILGRLVLDDPLSTGLGAGSLHRIGDIERRWLLLALRVFGIRRYRALPSLAVLRCSVLFVFVFHVGMANTNRRRRYGVAGSRDKVWETSIYQFCRNQNR
jgi:hypothetical protein